MAPALKVLQFHGRKTHGFNQLHTIPQLLTVPPGVLRDSCFSLCHPSEGCREGPAWQMKAWITKFHKLCYQCPTASFDHTTQVFWLLTQWLPATPGHEPLHRSHVLESQVCTTPEGSEGQRGRGIELGNPVPPLYSSYSFFQFFISFHILTISSVREADLWIIPAIIQFLDPNDE